MKPLKVYACYNEDSEVRLQSSSGAVFTALSEEIILSGGVVYGVAMSEDCYSAEFIRVTEKNKLNRLRGSKYLQAKVRDTYKKVKNDLLLGRDVLFTGTGCQINGLKKYLEKDYYNLFCVDVICHGTPSPALWRKYVMYQEKKHGGKLEKINFRCKDEGWQEFGMEEIFLDTSKRNRKKIYISKDKDAYMQMFLRDECLRPSCYECAAKIKKWSDISIADFWGIDEIAYEMNDKIGTSLVIIRTMRGYKLFDRVSEKMKLKSVSYEEGVSNNPAEYCSCQRPKLRNTFFKDMYALSFDKLVEKYAAPIKISISNRFKRKIKHMIEKLRLN